MVFFYKMTHGLINVNPSIVPVFRRTRPTRYSISNITKYIEPKCKTVTYKKSYVIRCIRIWNTLAGELNLCMDRLIIFKGVMSKYYFSALSNYDCENPRTFKSVCLKCNKCRSFRSPHLLRLLVLKSITC